LGLSKNGYTGVGCGSPKKRFPFSPAYWQVRTSTLAGHELSSGFAVLFPILVTSGLGRSLRDRSGGMRKADTVWYAPTAHTGSIDRGGTVRHKLIFTVQQRLVYPLASIRADKPQGRETWPLVRRWETLSYRLKMNSRYTPGPTFKAASDCGLGATLRHNPGGSLSLHGIFPVGRGLLDGPKRCPLLL